MKKYIFSMLFFAISTPIFAEIGDTITINKEKIVEIRTDTTKNSKGKEVIEIIVIYKNNEGKKKLAYMTKTDYKKLEKANKYNLDIEYMLIELKTKFKLIVK